MRARQRAVAPALVWGREPRGAGRGQTGPKGTQNLKRALRRSALGAAGPNHGKKTQPPRATGRARVARGPRGALCESKPRRAVLLWLTWRPKEAHAAVLLCPGCHARTCRSAPRRALWKRALAVGVAPWPLCGSARRRAAVLWLFDVAPCRSARRRAVAPSGCQRARSVKANPAVLFCSGWCGP